VVAVEVAVEVAVGVGVKKFKTATAENRKIKENSDEKVS
jgi:hypothetical protein